MLYRITITTVVMRNDCASTGSVCARGLYRPGIYWAATGAMGAETAMAMGVYSVFRAPVGRRVTAVCLSVHANVSDREGCWIIMRAAPAVRR